jgi:hypothetical protein
MNTTSFFDIGIWLSACGLLATAGLFLDRYHITNNTRDVARSTAIKAFIYLDRPWLQYPRRYIYNAISGFIMEKRFILLGALALISYTVVVCAFWLGRSLNGEKPPEGFITYTGEPMQ